MAYGLTKSLSVARASTQYAAITDAASTGLNITGALTVECWFKLDSLPGSGEYYGLVSRGGIEVNLNRAHYGIRYDNDTARRLAFYVYGGAFKEVTYTQTLSTDTWYHLAGVYVPSTSLTLYLDGSQVAQNTTSIPASLTSSAWDTGVGNFLITHSNNHNGHISLARIWSTNRSGTDISDNMCTVYGTATTNLQAEWSLNDVYTDASGNSNTLTPVNTPTFATDTPSTCASTPSVNSGFFNFM